MPLIQLAFPLFVTKFIALVERPGETTWGLSGAEGIYNKISENFSKMKFKSLGYSLKLNISRFEAFENSICLLLKEFIVFFYFLFF